MRWLVPLGLLVAALAIAGCGSSGPSVSAGSDLGNGREIFNQGWNGEQSCASCHTLKAAGSKGTIGPNLDLAFAGAREQGFEESTFEQVVREQIAYPGIGLGMPADLVEGEDADDVAYFVAQCAANADDPVCAPPSGRRSRSDRRQGDLRPGGLRQLPHPRRGRFERHRRSRTWTTRSPRPSS